MDELEIDATQQGAADEVLRRRAESLAQESISEEATDRLALLLFRIGEEWYSVKVGDVREIYQEYAITPVPCVPDHVLGVVNIRGEILSVTDIARMMRLGAIDMNVPVQPPAIVVQNDECVTALVVDEIGDIADVSGDSIEPPVSIIDRAQADFVSGSVAVSGTMVGLLNVDRVLEPIGGPSGRA